jgi:serine/threonine protein phosphatase PrpC
MSHCGYVRSVNEDSFLDSPQRGLWVVADGMGGHEAGDVASRMIVDAIQGLPQDLGLAQSLDWIEDALEEVNGQLLAMAREGGEDRTIGSTVMALVAQQHLGAFLWAGDSRLYRLRAQALERLSTDHSQVEQYVTQGQMTREQADQHPDRHIITRAVGSGDELYLDAELCQLRAGDRYLLCTDGLTRHIPETELADLLSEGDARSSCLQLINTTLDRGAKDNVTAVVIDIVS